MAFRFDPADVSTVFFFVMTSLWAIRRTNKKNKKATTKYKHAIETKKTEAYALYPRVDPLKCLGCGACTAVCPEGDILQMVNNFPVLVNPTKCVGHSLCFKSCPYQAITMVFGTKTTGKQVPNYDGNYQTNVPGLYIAGELGGMGLIANAIKQGSWAADHAIKNLDKSVKTDIDVLVVGAGPSGLSAALKCIEMKVKYRCIDQNTFGGTVFNFPRQKLVMSHPATLPIIGKMSFPGAKIIKEDLLKFWDGVKAKTGLKVEEKVKFSGLKVDGKVLIAETSAGVIKAQKIILCVGVGGSPRKLGLANEDMDKVCFKLSDPAQYQGKHMCIVGAGDSAVEAAQRAAEPQFNNTTHLIVRADSLSRCKEDNKNRVEKLEKEGRLKIWYKAAITEIHKDKLIVKKDTETLEIPNDYLILFMGTIPPFGFLQELGVEIRTLHGDPLGGAPGKKDAAKTPAPAPKGA